MTEPKYMICGRTGSQPHVPSIVRQCCKCNHDVWVSPASAVRADEGGYKPVCFECSNAALNALPEVRVDLSLSEAQREEALATLKQQKNPS